MLPYIVRCFREKYPGIYLLVREGTTFELVEGMGHGEYDLCLTLRPEEGELFESEKVFEEELVLVVPGGFAALSVKCSQS